MLKVFTTFHWKILHLKTLHTVRSFTLLFVYICSMCQNDFKLLNSQLLLFCFHVFRNICFFLSVNSHYHKRDLSKNFIYEYFWKLLPYFYIMSFLLFHIHHHTLCFSSKECGGKRCVNGEISSDFLIVCFMH